MQIFIILIFWVVFYTAEGLHDLALTRESIARGPGNKPVEATKQNRRWHMLDFIEKTWLHIWIFATVGFGFGWPAAVSVSSWGVGVRQLLHDGIINLGLNRPFVHVSTKSTSRWDGWLNTKPVAFQLLLKVGPVIGVVVWEFMKKS